MPTNLDVDILMLRGGAGTRSTAVVGTTAAAHICWYGIIMVGVFVFHRVHHVVIVCRVSMAVTILRAVRATALACLFSATLARATAGPHLCTCTTTQTHKTHKTRITFDEPRLHNTWNKLPSLGLRCEVRGLPSGLSPFGTRYKTIIISNSHTDKIKISRGLGTSFGLVRVCGVLLGVDARTANWTLRLGILRNRFARAAQRKLRRLCSVF